ncbi:MAG: hypothetical protein IJ215_01350 [Clostridia bacterium]|nr:hypothetical protein [Clostridia bacterium]
MKTKILLALRELLIYLIITGLLILIAFLLLRNYYPQETIPEASKYSVLERDNYKVIGDIQNEQNPTVVYDTKSPRIETDQTELRYIPGSVNPFVAQQGGSDLPTDIVGTSSNSSGDAIEESDVNGEPVEENASGNTNEE